MIDIEKSREAFEENYLNEDAVADFTRYINKQGEVDYSYENNDVNRAWHDWDKAWLACAEANQLEIKRLIAALQLLLDNQNGCPLPKYEDSRNEAIKFAQQLRKRYELRWTWKWK
jgi:hypothetical protein